jgi:hypothetical protein
MTTTMIFRVEALRTGETCVACGEEMTLEPAPDGQIQIGCGCSCASVLD